MAFPQIGKWLDGNLDWYSDSHMGDTQAYRLRVATFHVRPGDMLKPN